jgi:hypothetical protein
MGAQGCVDAPCPFTSSASVQQYGESTTRRSRPRLDGAFERLRTHYTNDRAGRFATCIDRDPDPEHGDEEDDDDDDNDDDVRANNHSAHERILLRARYGERGGFGSLLAKGRLANDAPACGDDSDSEGASKRDQRYVRWERPGK